MFSPNHPDIVTQQVSQALQPEPPSKINDMGKKVGPSSLRLDSPPSTLAFGFLEVIDEMRKW